MATPEIVKDIKTHLGSYGLSESDLMRVDPYLWGGHYQRLLLWIARGNLRINHPSDTTGQRDMISSNKIVDGSHRAMIPLEIGNRNLCFNRLEALGFEVVSDPKQPKDN